MKSSKERTFDEKMHSQVFEGGHWFTWPSRDMFG